MRNSTERKPLEFDHFDRQIEQPKLTRSYEFQHISPTTNNTANRQLEDSILIRRYVTENDQQAFDEIVHEYGERILHMLQNNLSPEDAEDVWVITFQKAAAKLGTFRGDSSLYTWLYQIAHNAMITKKIRSRAQIVATGQKGNDDYIPDYEGHEPDPSARITSQETREQIFVTFSRMNPEEADLLRFFHLEQMKYQEIADRVRIPLGTVRSRLHRARERFAALFKANNADDFA